MRLVNQLPSIGGAIERRSLPPWRSKRLIVAEHALPGGARMRRLDQGVSEIAKQPFVVGELELRRTQADARRRLAADPAVHVLLEKILVCAGGTARRGAPERRASP